MGLRADIQEALAEAFDEEDDLADVVVSFTLVKITTGVYDPDTDSRNNTEKLFTSRGVFSSFGVNEVDGVNIKSEDEKLIVLANEISGKMEIDDLIRLSSGVEYFIIKNKPVMGGESTAIIFEVQVRKNAS